MEYPDITVSVGTTYNSNAKASTPKAYSARSGLVSHGKSLYKIAIDHIASALDSEKTWLSYMNVLQPPSSHEMRYVRFNPPLDEDPPRLDKVEDMTYLQEIVRENLDSDVRIQRVALQLIASSFYFEKSTALLIEQDGSIKFKGMVWIRRILDSSHFTKIIMQDTSIAGSSRIARKSMSLGDL